MCDLLEEFERMTLREENSRRSKMFKPPPLLWDRMAKRIQPAEMDTIKTRIGEELIDSNAELHEEILGISEILHEVNEKNEGLKREADEKLKSESLESRALRNEIKKHLVSLSIKHGCECTLKGISSIMGELSETENGIVSYACSDNYSNVVNTPRSPPKTSSSFSKKRIRIEQTKIELESIQEKMIEEIREILAEEQELLGENLKKIRGCLRMETQFCMAARSLGSFPEVPKMSRFAQKLRAFLSGPRGGFTGGKQKTKPQNFETKSEQKITQSIRHLSRTFADDELELPSSTSRASSSRESSRPISSERSSSRDVKLGAIKTRVPIQPLSIRQGSLNIKQKMSLERKSALLRTDMKVRRTTAERPQLKSKLKPVTYGREGTTLKGVGIKANVKPKRKSRLRSRLINAQNYAGRDGRRI